MDKATVQKKKVNEDKTSQRKKESVNLNCYTIRFWIKGKRNMFLPYKEVFPGLSFSSMMQSFIQLIDGNQANGEVFINDDQNRSLELDKLLTASSTIYSGRLKKGNSGHETYVQERSGRGMATVGTIRTDQFNATPFYFLMSLPKQESPYIIFLAQSYKQYGFKELFEDAFKKFYGTRYPDSNIICEFQPLSIAKQFKEYISAGKIRKLRLRKHGLTPELENAVSGDNYQPKDYEVELSVKMKKRGLGFLGRLQYIDLESSSFVEIFKVDGFEFDEALIDVSAGNRKRVLNFMDPNSFAASYDLTDKIGTDPHTRHPQFERLDHEAKSILNEEIIPNIKS